MTTTTTATATHWGIAHRGWWRPSSAAGCGRISDGGEPKDAPQNQRRPGEAMNEEGWRRRDNTTCNKN